MGRKKNTEERRIQIGLAAIKVMGELGYENASIATIAKTASLTSGLLHYHFKSKREVFLHALVLLETRHWQAWDEACKKGRGSQSAALKLNRFIDYHLRLDRKESSTAESDFGYPKVADARRMWATYLAESARQPEVYSLYQQSLLRFRKELESVVRMTGAGGKGFKTGIEILMATMLGYLGCLAVPPRYQSDVDAKGMAAPVLVAPVLAPRILSPGRAAQNTKTLARKLFYASQRGDG